MVVFSRIQKLTLYGDYKIKDAFELLIPTFFTDWYFAEVRITLLKEIYCISVILFFCLIFCLVL